VFTPTILTILGVIMFLRVGWIVGGVGLGYTLLIVIISNVITFITALSLSSLATSMRVGVGGAYYLISRSFGLEVGGAVGIPLYLSQTLSVTLYAYGMAESMTYLLPDMVTGLPGFLPVTAALIIVGVAAVAAKSTELSLKLQRPIIVLIILSLISLFVGVSWTQELETRPISDMLTGGGGTVPFWVAFAVFFPAVTGILSGVSLSGDLKDPGKSIPQGVLSAVVVGFVIYLFVPVALFLGADTDALVNNSLVWQDVSAVSFLVLPGLWGAVLSSAFGSILSAPRTLQALADDRLAPRLFSQTDEKTGEPVLGLVVSAGVALVAVVLGDLNAVAEWLTVFFLTTYGALNAVALFEIVAGDPAFRPRVKVPWWAALGGAVGCGVAMFAINPVACMGALIIEMGIFLYIRRRSLRTTWGDVRNGLWLSMARFALLHLRGQHLDPRSWRPHILLFTADLARTIPLVRLSAALGQQRGVVTVVTLKVGELDEREDYSKLQQRNEKLLDQHRIVAFAEIAAVPTLLGGVLAVAQSNGFAGLSSNTIAFGWSETGAPGLANLLRQVRKLEHLDKCSMICRNPPVERRGALFVVWWTGKENNGDLMLLFAHLLTQASGWENSRIVLRSVVEQRQEVNERKAEFEEMLEEIRISAEVEVLERAPDLSIPQMITEHSQDAALSFLGFRVPEEGEELAVAQDLIDLTDGIPSAVLVRNGGPYRGMLV
jgi:amino acid transporter